jgi:DNA (cytosine-5)-methyltransferase 1
MPEIAEIPLNGRRVVSLFSGCGGSSLGYRMAGYRVIWANEFIAAARETYAANFPDTPIDGRDIRDITGDDILSATGLALGELDILDGSPPCASFSSAGKRDAHWGKVKRYSDTKQRTDDLFFEYARIVAELKPRRFIAENVSGLVRGVGKGAFLEILAALKAVGYRVQCRLLDAQWLGVPQSRQRIFFVGVRDDLAGDPGFPKPLPYRYSVRDALPWISAVGGIRETGFSGSELAPASQPSPTIMAGGGGGMNTSQFGVVVGLEHANGYNGHAPQSINKPAATIQATRPVAVKIRHGNKAPFEQKGKPIRPMPTVMGGDTLGLAPYQFEIEAEASGPVVIRQGNGNGHSSSRGKVVSQDKPLPTIMARGSRYSGATDQFIIEAEADISRYAIHPTERRRFSIAELRRICGFPDDFVLTGTYAQQWERLGRAVPPPMMAALAGAQS